jgi:hypothetical protein
MVIKCTGSISIKGTKPSRLLISHTEIRNILLKHGKVSSRQSKITLGSSTDPEYNKKKRIKELRYSIILYEDEKGPIAS